MARLAAEYDIGLALEQTVSENRDICLTNKIFVYLLAGVAIIATGTRGQKPLMEKISGAGLCYDPGDIQRLAQQLREWEVNREALLRARQYAWQFGEEKYNWDFERRKLLTVVERSLSRAILK
jgi:hypothetical protein